MPTSAFEGDTDDNEGEFELMDTNAAMTLHRLQEAGFLNDDLTCVKPFYLWPMSEDRVSIAVGSSEEVILAVIEDIGLEGMEGAIVTERDVPPEPIMNQRRIDAVVRRIRPLCHGALITEKFTMFLGGSVMVESYKQKKLYFMIGHSADNKRLLRVREIGVPILDFRNLMERLMQEYPEADWNLAEIFRENGEILKDPALSLDGKKR